MANHPSFVFCSRAAPSPYVDASQTSRVSRFWSNSLFCVISVTKFFILWNAESCSADQLSVLCLSVFLRRGRSAAAACAKCGMYLVR